MPKTKFVDFKAIKAAVTMEQILDRYDLLHAFKRNGDRLSGPCPIHKGSNPTQFSVSISKNVWNCFSECKHGGNVLDFIARMENLSIHAAAIKAIEWFQLDAETAPAESDNDPREDKRTPTHNSKGDPTKATPVQENGAPNKPLKFRLDKLDQKHPYLADRGLSIETAVDFGVGYCAKGMMAGRIAIPIHNLDGNVVAYAGRCPGEPDEGTPKYKLPQGFRKSLELFNFDRARKEPGPLVVVEGFFGCMRLHQLGKRKVVALMGSTLSATQEELIRTHTEPSGQIIVMLDEDEAGRAGREDMAVRLTKFAFVRVHTFDEEGQQPDDLTQEELAAVLP